jgi:hypothetical protein
VRRQQQSHPLQGREFCTQIKECREGYNVHDGVDVRGVHVLGSIGLQSLGDGASELSLRAAAALAMDA